MSRPEIDVRVRGGVTYRRTSSVVEEQDLLDQGEVVGKRVLVDLGEDYGKALVTIIRSRSSGEYFLNCDEHGGGSEELEDDSDHSLFFAREAREGRYG